MRVMAFGTFDNFHPGHLSYLSQAGAFGDELIVVVARDKNVLKIKGHEAHENENTRREKVGQALKDLGLPGRAILGGLRDRWEVVKKFRPEIICLGYDQNMDLKALERLMASERFFCEVKRLEPFHPEKYKSSFCRGLQSV